MINEETKLKVQAYLDDELDPEAASQVMALMGQNAEARKLYEELALTKTLLAGNELAFGLPEQREFYWHGIEQRLLREMPEETAVGRRWVSFDFLWRWVVPAVGVAGCLALILASRSPRLSSGRQTGLPEVEGATADANFISFYSPAAGVTVVWVDTDTNDGN